MQAILKTCIQVEEQIGSIYAELAGHPDAEDELRAMWQTMADDEVQHANRISLLAERLEAAGVRELSLSAEQAQALLDRAGEIFSCVQERRLSVEEAVYASVELEDAFMQVHLNYGNAGGQPDLQTMFKALAEEDRRHTAQLRSWLQRVPDGAGLVFSEQKEKP